MYQRCWFTSDCGITIRFIVGNLEHLTILSCNLHYTYITLTLSQNKVFSNYGIFLQRRPKHTRCIHTVEIHLLPFFHKHTSISSSIANPETSRTSENSGNATYRGTIIHGVFPASQKKTISIQLHRSRIFLEPSTWKNPSSLSFSDA